MKILVTGGSGFIGSHIVDKLISLNHEVAVLDFKKPYQKNVKFIKGDFTSLKTAKKAVKGMDIVFHIAGFSNIDKVKDNPLEAVKLNIYGTAVMLDEARKSKVKRFLFASSVYVDDKMGHIYTSSKASSEMLCQNFFTLYGLPYTILRFGTVYGERSRMADVISRFVETAFRQNKIFVYGSGRQKRNFIYAKDLAEACVKAMSDAGKNKIYEIAGPKSTSVISLAEIVKAEFDGKPKIIIAPFKKRFDDYSGRIKGVNKTMRELKWKPKYELKQGIEGFIKWYLKNNKNI